MRVKSIEGASPSPEYRCRRFKLLYSYLDKDKQTEHAPRTGEQGKGGADA
jgi:hypothetical protein